jgi:hypothetical protein
MEKLKLVPPVVGVGVWAEDTCPTDGELGAPEELLPVAVDGFGA